MAKTKEQKRIEREQKKEQKKVLNNSKRVAEMHRLEEKKAANAPTLDDNMAAVEKTLNMFNEAYEKEEKKKKKKPIVFILSAALIVSSAVAGVGLHLANRNNSNDSRFWKQKYVPAANLRAKARLITFLNRINQHTYALWP